MKKMGLLALLALTVTLFAHKSDAELWMAQSIEAHEWGVNVFDWGKNLQQEPSDIPDFVYTHQNPGKQLAPAIKRAKDLPPDRGERKKPILYFYPGNFMREEKYIPIGVEVSFAKGNAICWWPQINKYRTSEEVKKAKPIDWKKWKTENDALDRYMNEKVTPVPDDGRMQLNWFSLKLTAELAKDSKLSGDKLPADHWINLAREVDAGYLSNGQETERFLFYEGKTSETPVLLFQVIKDESGRHAMYNTGKYPIYDIFVIQREGNKSCVQYFEKLKPMSEVVKSKTPFVEILPLIVTSDKDKGKGTEATCLKPMPEKEFRQKTTDKLVRILSKSNIKTQDRGVMGRDPADPQGPTQSHLLFDKEAVALEKIWRKDFFESEGLTVIYREDVKYLDEVMPLNLYTNMSHYIELSRAGLVLNKNIPLKDMGAISVKLNECIARGADKLDAQDKSFLTDNCFVVANLLRSTLISLEQINPSSNADVLEKRVQEIRNLKLLLELVSK